MKPIQKKKHRKTFLRVVFSGVVLAFVSVILMAEQSATGKTEGKFMLPPLPYATDALEPVISERTMLLHYGKHLKGYVDNLNQLIRGTDWENSDLVTIVKESEGALFNNAGQSLNHFIYFSSFSSQAKQNPEGPLLKAIEEQWGSTDGFKKAFTEASTGLFGSGWAWLSKDISGKLHITQESNAGNPVTKDLIPLLGFDVWEHAYYLDYENRRKEHIDQLWQIVDWKVIEARYEDRNRTGY